MSLNYFENPTAVLNKVKLYKENISNFPLSHPKQKEIKSVFLLLTDFIFKEEMDGCCHLISAYFHVLLNELGVQNELNIGFVREYEQHRKKSVYEFSHSWIEIDNVVYDVALQMRFGGDHSPAVFSGMDMKTLTKTKDIYGISTDYFFEFDILRNVVLQDLKGYFEPVEQCDLGWDKIVELGANLNLFLSKSDLIEKYGSSKRNIILHQIINPPKDNIH